MQISDNDIKILRELATKYMEYASLPIQNEKTKLWKRLNSLNMTRPMVAIDQMPWNELNPDGVLDLKVGNPYFRSIEQELKRQVYKWEHLPVDMVLDPYILLPRPISNSGYGIKIETDKKANGSINSLHFTSVINEFEDIEKIKTPIISISYEKEAEILEAAAKIFSGIADFKLKGIKTHLGLWDFITQYMSPEECYINFLERPEFMHAVIDRFTNAALGMIEQINQQGLYDINENICHCSYTFDDSLPTKKCDINKPTTFDGWGFGLAQLFTCTSPQITEEFEVPYMQKLFANFGAVYYGCCEKLDDRLDIIEKMPNIRKVSCSPWSDRENFAEKLSKKYIMSNKPSPAFLSDCSFDEEAVRNDLRRTIEAAKTNNTQLEIILKDISTVQNKPSRLWRWAEIAMEEVNR